MKFMLMMHATLEGCAEFSRWSQAELKAHIAFMKDLNEGLTRSGELVLAEGLDFPPRPRIVRAKQADDPMIHDGPFAETKEFLAGFWIVDVATPERAIGIAASASVAPGPGGAPMGIPIEVRQVMDAPEL